MVRVNLPIDHPFASGYNLLLDGDVVGSLLTVTGSADRHHDDLLPQGEIDRTLLYGEPVRWILFLLAGGGVWSWLGGRGIAPHLGEGEKQMVPKS